MYRIFVKRFLDLVIALCALPFLLIIILIVSPIIYLEDKGSIFYNANRLGKNGKLFKMYKFRSLKMNAKDLRNKDGSTYNAEDDPRLTKTGKFIRKTSIDEIPQILNVIKGDMSLIGPRPTVLTSDFNDIQGIRRKRYEVRPGITGYTQALFRNSITQKEKFMHDAEYVDNLSLKLDIKIILLTIKTVIMKKNVYLSAKSTDNKLKEKEVYK